MFFDDILVYNWTMEDHVQNLLVVLKVLRDNALYANQNKSVCSWKIEYLGHLILGRGVEPDSDIIRAMLE